MKIVNLIVAIVIVLIVILAGVSFLFTDLFWFNSLGFGDVYMTILLTTVGMGALFAVIFFAFSLLNIKLARRFGLSHSESKDANDKPFILLALIFAIFVGVGFANWEVVLKFLNPSVFSAIDPVFGLDIGFFVFSLPFYQLVFNFLIATMLLNIVISLLFYLTNSGALLKKADVEDVEIEGDSELKRAFAFDLSKIKKKVTPHMSILLAITFFIAAFGFSIAQYGLLFNSGDVFYGAGFSDLNVSLLFLNIGVYVSIIVGILFILNLKIRRWKLPLEGIAALAIVMFIGILAAGVVQIFQVGPDEYNIERPYLGYNIEGTIAAYGLDSIENKDFPVSYDLTMADINQNSETINNIRLWDWRPLKDTFTQLQLFRTYYDFGDVDIDRYQLNGDYKEVMISPRELDINDLSTTARTWVNEHLVYTHGYGLVMNPVDKVSSEGLPEFYIKDLPPQSSYANLNIDRPEIYYGEKTSQYVISKTTTEEFDYPSGDQNIYTSYEGTGGVPIGDLFTKLMYAIRFGSIELLFSGSLTAESKILLHRDIEERVETIAPFLQYDFDPYIVVSEGRLYWIQDVYVTTDMYPYSEPVYSQRLGYFNYIRNSVKTVIDAYNGDVTYYVVDSSEPLIQTYMSIFPSLFKDISEMPSGVRDHIRYPEDLFSVQALLYSTYHMRDPQVFYNKEDVWTTPNEVYRGSTQPMIPYYVIMKLPGAQDEDFIMMLPFKPAGKQNMIGWMSANSDPEEYGKITVYQFSKQELVYGPMQIESRIDQDTEISQLITLWSQSGSSVIRGNTLIIPIKDSILYIEPLYLQATQEGSLPQLKRVIVAYNDVLTMQETLGEALSEIFGGQVIIPGGDPGTGTGNETLNQVLSHVSELYEQAQAALQAGDFATYAQYIEDIGTLLEQYGY
jgi:uncharacterized membrane protein (UPF0182 family)